MGKLLHKLIQGILPSWVLKRFFRSRASSRKLPYLKIAQNNYMPAIAPQNNYMPAASSESPSSSSSSSLPDTHRDEPAAYLMDVEENIFYYSYSEDDQENLNMAGHGTDNKYMAMGFHHHDIHHHHHHQDHHPHQFQHPDDRRRHDEMHDRHYAKLGEQNSHDHLGYKRKSLVLDAAEDEDDCIDDNNNGNNKPPCLNLKRRRRANVRCELPEGISEIVGKGSAIVQYTYKEPHDAFWESMVDMIVSNELWDVGRQESLLLCYLTLNDPHLYNTICSSFLQALEDLHSVANNHYVR